MKTLNLIITFILSLNIGISQCTPFDGWMTDQIQVDYFKLVYPNCNIIKGNLSIRGNIKNIDSLYFIKKIEGDLFFTNADSLISLEGFKNLDTVTGSIFISNANKLTNLEGLSNIKYFKSLYIKNNQKLIKINGFDNIVNNISNIEIENNANLSSIVGFKNTIGLNNLIIEYNRYINEIIAFDNVLYANVVSILRLDSLSSLKAMKKLKTVNDNLLFRGSEKLKSWEFGGNIDTIRNSLILASIGIDQMTGFSNLKACKYIEITAMINAESPPRFNNLEYADEIKYYKNSFKRITNTLPKLKILKDIDFDDNDQCLVINDFNSLERVTNRIRIDNHLEPLSELRGFEKLVFANEIYFHATNELKIFSAFQNLEEINHLELKWLRDGITHFNNFKNLKKINRNLILIGNTNIDDLSFLQGVNIDSVSKFAIYKNTKLSVCNHQTICDYLNTKDTINYNIQIYDNLTNCSSREQILANCISSLDNAPKNEISVFPNPSDHILNIEGIENQVLCKIYDLTGKLIMKNLTSENKIDISSLKDGFYVLTIDELNLKYKFIKI
ncbi:MAG TPA: T9SS type A sorting domain-containing protein [Saprospiraceae bacterium]|nr:T9SS type A sorting domain-containing protein [Saprospiraceae bacterium]